MSLRNYVQAITYTNYSSDIILFISKIKYTFRAIDIYKAIYQ